MNTRIETLAEIIRDEACARMHQGDDQYAYYKSILHHATEILQRIEDYRVNHPELYD